MITLQPLPFGYTDLEPVISKETLEFHHDKHHAAYVTKANALLENYAEFADMDAAEVLLNIDRIPDDNKGAVINSVGQVYNHDMYWDSIGPNAGGRPEGKLAELIDASFGSFEGMKEKFEKVALSQFGSGWTWLVVDEQGSLIIEKTANADSPLLHGRTPIFTMDVWEHAYYLDYQNKRAAYASEFWKIADWNKVAKKI